MKKGRAAQKGKKGTLKYASTKKKSSFLTNVQLFRWLKKSFSGKSQKESVDLLDQWILKKKAVTLFF